MLTHATSSSATQAASRLSTQTVLIVNGDSDVLGALEPMLEAGNYDVVFVEANPHAYSQIKRVQPHLVILCLDMDAPEGFQVLSMLKLDPDTRDIPVVTYATQFDSGEADASEDEEDEEDDAARMFTPPQVVLMN